MKKLLLTLFSITCAIGLFAQTGSIKGKVVDNATKESIIQAYVMITGTTKGTVTDFDGNYIITDLAPGKYSITVSYVGYKSRVFEAVEVKAGQATAINVNLSIDTQELGVVQVTGRVDRKTEVALQAMQRNSAVTISTISSEEMSMMGTSNVAESAGRVSGVSVQDGKYVYVRGLGDRYMKTQLNGAEIPSLDPQKNTVQLDIFPSNIIDNIVIFKTFSPDLPASFTGGYVNIVTKDFPNKFTLQASTSVGFNTKANLNSNSLTYEGGKTDWLGFDDGSRTAPIQQGDLPELYVIDREKTTELTEKFNKTMSPERKLSGLNHGFSVSLGDQKELFGRKIGFVSSLSYKKSYSSYFDAEKGRYELTAPSSSILEKKRTILEDKSSEKVLIGGLLNTTYKYASNHSVGLNLVYNQSGISGASLGQGYNSYHEVFYTTRSLKWLERSFGAAQLIGKQTFSNGMKVNWLASYSKSRQSEPDLRFFNNVYEVIDGDTIFEIDQAKDKLPARYFREMNENNIDIHGDFIVPVAKGDIKGRFKTGGAFFYKYRTFDEILYEYSNGYFDGNVDNYLKDENIGSNVDEGYGMFINETFIPSNNYSADQRLVSAYAMFDLEFSKKWKALFGARLEDTYIETVSQNEKNGIGTLSNTEILPALNITFMPEKKRNLRFAYTRTVAMPSFRELAPYASYDYQTGETEIGNPELKNTLIDNFDVRWEMYMKPGEQFSIGYFFKAFHDPIEKTFNPQASNPELTFNNVPIAYVNGLEIDVRKKLDFIGLDNFKAGGNFTFVTSTVQIEERELESMQATDPGASDTRQMAGQAPYIVNGLLSYDNKDKKLKAALTYNISGPKLYVVVKGGTPNVFEQPRHMLGLGLSKGLGDHWKVKISAKNLLNSKSLKTYNFNGVDYTYSDYRKGQSFSVGFTYKID